MNVLAPLTSQPPSTRAARVRTLATSEPASGSVIASAPIFSPRIAGWSQRSTCSGVPNFAIGGVAMLVCAPIPAASPPDAHRASSSANTASATQSASGPYFRPSQPRSASIPNTSFGNHRAASHSPARGRSRDSTNARISARSAACRASKGGGSEAEGLANDLEHDLVGAGADPVQAQVAPHALDVVLLHVAGSAVDLDALVGDLAGDPRGVELRHRDLAHRVLAVREPPGGRVDELAGRLDLRRHLGELVAGHLELADRAPERLPLVRVPERLVEHRLRARPRARRADQPLALELPHDVVEALADLAEDGAVRDPNVLEREQR